MGKVISTHINAHQFACPLLSTLLVCLCNSALLFRSHINLFPHHFITTKINKSIQRQKEMNDLRRYILEHFRNGDGDAVR